MARKIHLFLLEFVYFPSSLPLFLKIFFLIFLNVVTLSPLSANGLENLPPPVTSRPSEAPTVILSLKTASHVALSMSEVIDVGLSPIANGSATLLTSPIIRDGPESSPVEIVTSSIESGKTERVKSNDLQIPSVVSTSEGTRDEVANDIGRTTDQTSLMTSHVEVGGGVRRTEENAKQQKDTQPTKPVEEEAKFPQVTTAKQNDQSTSDLTSSHLVETSLENPLSTIKSRREDEILDVGDEDDGVDEDAHGVRVDGKEEVVNCSYKRVGKTNELTGAEDNGVDASLNYEQWNNSKFFEETEEGRTDAVSSHSRVRRDAITLHGPLWTDKNTLFVELVAIGDYSFCQKYGSHSAIDRITKIVGITNTIFNPLDVVVVLSDIELWCAGDKASIYSMKENTLGSMTKYREEMIKRNPGKPNDNIVLITRVIEDGAGVASTGGMCSNDRSVSIIQDIMESDFRTLGLFLAHEMGHNFNMKHDGQEDGEYFSGLGRCEHVTRTIMQPALSDESYGQGVQWSGCSQNYIENMRKTEDLDCLKNVPTESYRSSCGNGIVESGEDCDCGPKELCKNSCCDPNTCRFTRGARCASGACCDTNTCQPLAAGTVCRSASDYGCDLSEYCSGDSERCPDDVYKGDGSYCGYYKQGYCYKGKCGDSNNRCISLWSSSAAVSDDACFQEYNKKNDRHGNCGQDPITKDYIHCDADSLKCGTLHCDNRGYGVSEKSVELGITTRKDYHVKEVWAGSSRCQYIQGFTHLYPMKDWLAPDGASCGHKKMCVNQRCIQISGTEMDCSRKCSGHGVCNSKGNCHCDAGYAPPDCSQSGSGGSYDSGAPRDVSSGGVIAAFVILSLVLLLMVLLIIMCCTWDRLRKWWEDSGRGKVSPLVPKAVTCIDNCFCVAVSKVIQWMVSRGPLGKISKPNLSDPEARRQRKKSSSYKVDVEVKRKSDPDFIDISGQYTGKTDKSLMRQHKPILPPNKHLDNITRPKYEQSISVDSGCVVDDNDEAFEIHSTNVSMSSLVNVFRNYNSKTSNDSVQVENRKPLMHDHHKEVSLRRLVTDPRSAHRNSKPSLPQPYQKPPALRHSVSVNMPVNNMDTSEKLSNNPFVISDKSDRKDNDKSAKKPVIPPYRSRTPPRATPPREIPPRPPIQENCAKKPVIPPSRSKTPPVTARVTPPRATPPRGFPPKPPVKEEVKILTGKGKDSTRFIDADKDHLQNTNKQAKVPGNRNVRNMAQRFENK